MKNQMKLLIALSMGMLVSLTCCDWFDFNKEETDPEKTIGKVDNYWKASAPGYQNAEIRITENNKGNVVASVSYEGKNYEVEGKITEEGIYDYVYSNGDKSKPFPLVKFDAQVGDKWEYKVGNQTVTREVIKRSTTDDTPYGFMYIKTIDVMETIPQGVQVRGATSPASNILWKFNHKFGFISATIIPHNGISTTISQYDTNAN